MSKPYPSPAAFATSDDYMAAVKREAQRRVIAASNKLRARKGLPLLDPETGLAPLPTLVPDAPAIAAPLAPPDTAPPEWRVGELRARAYAALMASRDGLPIEEVGFAVYGRNAYGPGTLKDHLAKLRHRAAQFGVVIPHTRNRRVARPYLRGEQP